jgi:hypothetical protein
MAVFDSGDWIAIGMSGVALVVTLGRELRERQSGRPRTPRLKVRVSGTVSVTGHDLGREYLTITATNPGDAPVLVSSVGFLVDGGKLWWTGQFPGDSLPHRFEHQASAKWHFPVEGLRASLSDAGMAGTVELVPFCADQMEYVYRGRATKLRID